MSKGPIEGGVLPKALVPDAQVLLGRLLEEVALVGNDYIEWPNTSSLVGWTLWQAMAAARHQDASPMWTVFMRMIITSSKNGSGKSTVADLTRWLQQSSLGRPTHVTPYGLIKAYKVNEVAILDDAQATFATDAAGHALIKIITNGYTPGATWVNGHDDGEPENASGHMVVVGTDQLIRARAKALADIIVRSMVIRLDRMKRYKRRPDADTEDYVRALGYRLYTIMAALEPQLLEIVKGLEQDMIGQLVTDTDGARTAEIWRPITAIARLAGGDWVAAELKARNELTHAGADLVEIQEAVDAGTRRFNPLTGEAS